MLRVMELLDGGDHLRHSPLRSVRSPRRSLNSSLDLRLKHEQSETFEERLEADDLLVKLPTSLNGSSARAINRQA